ncbi:MAG: CRISPR-associated protein Cas2 [Spirochaetes bacterium RBG_16_67_19]|nr:MAG: CRISPR-associated protein Cas2 [Spirochaetes bacterium GWB1_66_5]OHD76486.1 MAG: CRISPR-associated protein Cas2 [Spirochaetes bacterium RBG_16_67_19]
MFVAVACDLGNADRLASVGNLLLQYGFRKLQQNLYESAVISEKSLLRLKKELDGLTDSYDSLRFYQYPLEDTLVVSSLKEKKWRKLVLTVEGKGL